MAQVSRPKAITRSAYLAGSYSGHVRRAATKSASYRKVSRDKIERVNRSAERRRRERKQKKEEEEKKEDEEEEEKGDSGWPTL